MSKSRLGTQRSREQPVWLECVGWAAPFQGAGVAREGPEIQAGPILELMVLAVGERAREHWDGRAARQARPRWSERCRRAEAKKQEGGT